MNKNYRGWIIDFTLPSAPIPGYTAKKNGVVLTAPSRVQIEREVDKQVALEPSKEIELAL